MSDQREQRRRERRAERLQEEAERQGRAVDEVRAQLVDRELDRLERARAVQADVLLVTVTRAETDELVRAVEKETRRKVTRQQGQAGRYRILGDIGEHRVVSIRCKQGSYSPLGSAFTSYGALAETGATTLIGVGTAYGVNEIYQQIGDVLVSTSLALYEETDVQDAKVLPASPPPESLSWLAEWLRSIRETACGPSAPPREPAVPYEYRYDDRARVNASSVWVNRLRQIQQEQPDTLSFHFGTLLAGAAHIESEAFRDELVERVERIPSDYDPVVGGEMEAAGIAAACKKRDLDWLVVKGVSDFATAASRAQIAKTRDTAARNAAQSVLRALTLSTS